MKLSHFINGKLINKYTDINCEDEKNQKKYKFYLDNIANYIYITDRLVFVRENDDYIFELTINSKSTCNIKLKKENKEFIINVLSSSYIAKEKYIEFKYELETDNEEHHIILEIGD